MLDLGRRMVVTGDIMIVFVEDKGCCGVMGIGDWAVFLFGLLVWTVLFGVASGFPVNYYTSFINIFMLQDGAFE